jgi:hypothetical protein
MSQLAVDTIDTTFPLAKQYGDRLGRVVHILNSNIAWTERTPFSGIFNVPNKAGIPVPDNMPGATLGAAGNLTGDYSWAVTLYDENNDVEGNPSPTVALSSVTADRVSIDLTPITNERANTRATHYRLYRTLGAGSTGIFFFVAQFAITTIAYEDNSSDATIQANDTLLTDNDAPADESYGFVKAFKGYSFNVGSFDPVNDTEWDDDWDYSKLGNSDAHPLLNRVKVEPGRYGKLMCCEDSGDALIFYKRRAIFELHFDEEPSGVFGDAFGKTMNTYRGALNPRCVVNNLGTHFVMDEIGIYVNAGGSSQQDISKPLKRIWDRINMDASAWFWGACDDDAIYFAVALDGESLPRYMLVFDINAWHARQPAVWTMYEYDFPLIDGVQHRFKGTGAAAAYGMPWARIVCVMTESGHTGYLRAGYRDLAAPSLTVRGTVTSSSGATNFADTAAAFNGTNDNGDPIDLTGCYVFFELVNQDQADSRGWTRPYPITAHPNSISCTLGVAAPSAIPVGTRYVIGRIPNARIYTPVMGGDAPFRMKRAARTALEFQPCGIETSVRMHLALDRRAPEMVGIDYESTGVEAVKYDQGVLVKIGGSQQSGGRAGVHATPAAGDGFRNMQVILQADDVDCPAVIDGIYIDGIFEEIAEVP